MANACSDCYFAVEGPLTHLHCHRHNPIGNVQGIAIWPEVDASHWCGDGYDKTISKPMQPTPGPQATDAAMPVWVAPNPNPGGTLTHLNAVGDYLIRSGAGWITGISINTVAQNGSLTCYDGTDATGAVIAEIDVSKGNPSPQTAAPWGFAVGFFVALTGAADVTIVSHSREMS